MSYIYIKDKDAFTQSAPKGVALEHNKITILKKAVLNETLTIKLLNRAVSLLSIVVEESAIAKIILDIEDENIEPYTYQINLETKDNSNVKFLLITDIQSKDANFNFNSQSLKDSNMEFIGGFVSNILNSKVYLDLSGRGANLKVRTITVSAEDNIQSLDVHMTHKAPDTIAEMTNIGIAGKNGIVKINGVGTIEQGMKRSSAFQTLKGIITSDKAQIDVNPILIIDEFDVKAGHAATVGRIEEDVLYYLRSRGLSLIEAQKLIINGYLRPFIDEIDDELIKENVITLVNGRI